MKESPISNTDLEHLKTLSGSYEALFSKRAKLYKEMGLKNKVLKEHDFKQLILKHYTFLKRPIMVVENQIFIFLDVPDCEPDNGSTFLLLIAVK